MTQTKEEKNKVQSRNRFATKQNAYTSIKATIIATFERCKREHWTSDLLLTHRNIWIYNDAWKKLPNWVKLKLEGVWDTCHDLLWRELHVCYNHPDTGVLTLYSELAEQDGVVSRLNGGSSRQCWLEDGTLYPYI